MDNPNSPRAQTLWTEDCWSFTGTEPNTTIPLWNFELDGTVIPFRDVYFEAYMGTPAEGTLYASILKSEADTIMLDSGESLSDRLGEPVQGLDFEGWGFWFLYEAELVNGHFD